MSTVVRSCLWNSSEIRSRIACHDMTPDQRAIRLPWDRNCELAFVNLLRQFDANNHASRIVDKLVAVHAAVVSKSFVQSDIDLRCESVAR